MAARNRTGNQSQQADRQTFCTLRFPTIPNGADPESLTIIVTRRLGEPERIPFVLRDIPLADAE
jgi:hypothetical protein